MSINDWKICLSLLSFHCAILISTGYIHTRIILHIESQRYARISSERNVNVTEVRLCGYGRAHSWILKGLLGDSQTKQKQRCASYQIYSQHTLSCLTRLYEQWVATYFLSIWLNLIHSYYMFYIRVTHFHVDKCLQNRCLCGMKGRTWGRRTYLIIVPLRIQFFVNNG